MINQFLAKVAKTWVKTDSRTRRALIGPQRVAIGKVTFKSKKSFKKPSTKVAMTANVPNGRWVVCGKSVNERQNGVKAGDSGSRPSWTR